MTDRHFTVKELAASWQVSTTWIRRRFRYESGVIKLGRVWRIPQQVAERVYRQAMVPTTPYRLPKLIARRLPNGLVALLPREDNGARSL